MLGWPPGAKLYGTTILSIGSNDTPGMPMSRNLLELRRTMPARRVIWLLPYSRQRAYIVASIAATFGDETLDMVRFASRDNIHPISYRQVAQALLR